MRKFLLVSILLIISNTSKAEYNFKNWSGLYAGIHKSTSNLSSYAIDPTVENDYAPNIDKDQSNYGFLIGYNFQIKNFLIGAEYIHQNEVGKQLNVIMEDGTDLGSVVYENMYEYKLKLGYVFNDFLINVKYGTGDLYPYWKEWDVSDPPTTHDYETKSIGIDRKIYDNFLYGIDFNETTLDVSYSSYFEEIHLKSYNFRICYIF